MINPTSAIEVTIGDFKVQHDHLVSFTIDQQYNQHHEFTCLLHAASLKSQADTLIINRSKHWLGKQISFNAGENKLQFEGIICGVDSVFGQDERIKLTGYSPSVMLSTNGGHYESFSKLTLAQLVQKIKDKVTGTALKWEISNIKNCLIDYITIYNEDYFNFLNRLSAAYGEFFFYDGKVLNFGKAKKTKEIKLEYKKEIETLQTSMQVRPIKFEQYSYNYLQDPPFIAKAPAIQLSNILAKNAYQKSESLFTAAVVSPAEIEVEEIEDLLNYQEIRKKAITSKLVEVSGSSTAISLSIGCHMHAIQGSTEIGKFLITKIRHEFDEGGYWNTFSGVLSDVEILEVDHIVNPVACPQVGFVVDNIDPEGLAEFR